MTMAMMVAHFKEEDQAALGSPGIDELRFVKSVCPGDTLYVTSELLAKRRSQSRPEMGSVRTQICTFNQNDEMVLSFVGISLYKLRNS